VLTNASNPLPANQLPTLSHPALPHTPPTSFSCDELPDYVTQLARRLLGGR
jgi:hypothetical protein